MIGKKSGVQVFLVVLISALFFSLFCALSEAEAQSSARAIITVRVKGNKAISIPTILSKIKTKPGEYFSQEVINDDIRRLYALGFFTDVAIDVEDYKEGVMVTVIVEEKPVIEEIVFEGNKRMRTPRLKKVMQLKEGDMLNYSKLSEDISEIKSFYERNGFYQASVRYELEKDDELNEATIRIVIDEQRRIRVKRIFVEGNESIKTKKILGLMQTRPAWFFRRGFFDDDMFEGDLSRIKRYYQDMGFLDITVTPSFDYEEEKGFMYITLKIDEGAQYHVRNIIIEGNIVLPEGEIRKRISLEEWQPFSYTKLAEDIENVRSLYYGKGYMNAEIAVDRVVVPEEKRLDIVYDIDAKEVVYIGRIDISGNTKTKDIVIRRELRVYPGGRFDGDKLKRSKERLYNLGFFEDIYFETTPTEKPDVNNLNISVKETKTGEFSFGGGYSSVDEFIGFVQIRQKNFDILNFPYFTGDGQNLALRAQIGMSRSDYDLSWTEPWIFDYPLSFGFDAYHRTHLRRSYVGYGYNEVRAGGDVRLGKEFLEYFRSDLMYRLENIDISGVSSEASQDERDEEGKNWLSSLILGVTFDNRDNIYTPTRGFTTTASIENTGGFLMGDKDFIKSFLLSSFYYSPIQKIVVEVKGRAGLANSYGDTDKVPIYERFYAGGANTIRGYRERKVGPRDPSSNDPIGGEAVLVGNVELTFPIYEKVIKGALFYDVGNVWGQLEDFAQGNYKQGTGVGIRVKTPIGPIKLDWGYPLNENQDDKREGQFYFSVSHGF